MILGLYPEEFSDRAVKALEVNIAVFTLLLSLMADTEGATESGHGGHVWFPASSQTRCVYAAYKPNQTPSIIQEISHDNVVSKPGI